MLKLSISLAAAQVFAYPLMLDDGHQQTFQASDPTSMGTVDNCGGSCSWNDKSAFTTLHLQVDTGCLPNSTGSNDSKRWEAWRIYVVPRQHSRGIPSANRRIALSNERGGD